MDVRVLGPLEVWDDAGEFATLGGPRLRRLFVAMVMAGGAVRSIDALSEAVWAEEESPEGARRTLMSYVSRLRTGLPAGMIEQIDPGYRVDPSGVNLDSVEFERLVVSGRRALQAGNAMQASVLFEEGLELWRGDPLAEFAGESWIEPERARLVELRGVALEGGFAARVELGAHAEVIGDLERAIAEFPDRERLHYLLMLALYRSGRQADALRQYQRLRTHLAELGLEPSAEVRELEGQILAHDASLVEPTVTPGSTVRGYQLGERIGEGAFGTIYVADQPAVGREVAVKVIRPEFANDPKFIRRFETEAQLVARLEHPHVVPLYDYWREPGGAYLVMRRLRGGTAEQRLVTTGPMTIDQVGRLVEQVGGALAAAHARGVVHRDVKPANILFDEDGIAYLADFGIAVWDEADVAGSELRSAGSPLYASPEQIRDGETTVRSDIYSFGILLFELLTGRAAFSAGSVQELLELKLRSPVPSVRTSRAELPETIDAVLEKATAADPVERFPDIAELMLAFRAAIAGATGSTTTRDSTGEESPRAAASRTLVNVQLEGVNPYKGLRAFQEADAQDFHGREQLVDELCGRIEASRLVAVVGASGSGKSSVVRAGVLPKLAQDELFVVTIVPGTHPMEELESGLRGIAAGEMPALFDQLMADSRGLVRAVRQVLPDDDSELVIAIDQFEEAFTLASPAECERFLDGLVAAVTDERSRVRVIATIRGDFYDRPLRHREFAGLLQDNTVNVVPMSRTELEAAIQGPAARMGVHYEEGLVQAIIADVGENAAMLPLMQYALTELYEQRSGAVMTRASYTAIGGVTGALAQRAEDLYQEADRESQDAVRRLFTRLVTPGEGVQDTRRRALRSELVMVPDAVIDSFGSHRLLSFDRDPATRAPTVEVAHEALIREWPTLRSWLDEDRDGLRIMRHLTSAAAAWTAADCDAGELYRGGRLDAALEWSASHGGDIAPQEGEFLDASRLLRQEEERIAADHALQRERQNRRLRRSLVGVGVFAIVAVVAGLFAFQQRESAQSQADEAAQARAAAETRRMISDASQLASTNRRVALLLAAEAAVRQPDSAASLGALQAVLSDSTQFLGYVGAGLEFVDVTWSAGGDLVAAHAGGVEVFNDDGEVLLNIDLPGTRLVDMSSDGAVIAVAGSDSTVRFFDGLTGASLGAPVPHGATITAMAFSRDDRWFVTGDRAGRLRTFDGGLELTGEWDAHLDADESCDRSALPADVAVPLPHEPFSFREGVDSVAVSKEGSHIVSTGGCAMRVWAAGGREPLLEVPVTRPGDDGDRLTVPIGVGFIVEDDREFLAVASPSSVDVWDIADRVIVDRWTYSGISSVSQFTVADASVAFGEGAAFAVGSDGTLREASSDGGLAIDTQFGGHLSIAVDERRERVVVAGADGAVIVSLAGTGLISRSVPAEDQEDWWVSADGRLVVGASVDTRPPQLWQLRENGYELVPTPDPDFDYGAPQVSGVAWAFDTERLLIAEVDDFTFVPNGRVYEGHNVTVAAWSGDGRLVAFGSGLTEPAVVRIYSRETGDLLALIDDFDVGRNGALIRSLGFSPDDSRFVATDDEGAARVYDTVSWSPLNPVLSAGGGAVIQAKFTPDGRYLVTAAQNGAVTLRHPESWQPIVTLLGNSDASEGFSEGPNFSEDGRWMVTTMDGQLRLWDLDSGELIGRPFPHDGQGGIAGARLGRFGTSIVGGRAVIWDLDTSRWREVACHAAGRNMTPEEWEQFGPDAEPYRATCPQWPSLDQPQRLEQGVTP